MSKAKAEIIGGVNLGDGTVYRAGDEDALAKVATAEQIAHLTGQGAITGFDAKADKAAAKAEEADAETEPETAKAETSKADKK